MDWKPFLRQLLICTGPWTCYFTQGLYLGFTTVLIPQLRRENITVTDEDASWFASLHAFTGIPWVVVLSALIVSIGRKKTHILVCFNTVLAYTACYFSTSVTHFFMAQIFIGCFSASHLTSCTTIITEYVSPTNRGIFLTLKCATFFWGVLVANTIGTFFHWTNIPLLGIVCSVYALLSSTVWPESPLWLASKGRFEECAAAHSWLKGDKEDQELVKLLLTHESNTFIEVVKKLGQKHFWKPILLSNLLVCLYSFSGKFVCTVYAIDIIKKITNSESTAYTGMLILDGVSVLSMYLGCFLSKALKRKVLLIMFSGISSIFLFVLSIYLYLVKLTILDENKYVSLVLLAGYSVATCCGPMIMATSLISELIPIKSRILSTCIIALTFKLTFGTFVKISPYFFKMFALHGTFALFATMSIVLLVLVYYLIPETKDMSIHEIDDCLISNIKKDVN